VMVCADVYVIGVTAWHVLYITLNLPALSLKSPKRLHRRCYKRPPDELWYKRFMLAIFQIEGSLEAWRLRFIPCQEMSVPCQEMSGRDTETSRTR